MLNSGLGKLLLPKGFYRSEYQMKEGPTKDARLGFALDPPRFLILKEVVNQGERQSQTKQPVITRAPVDHVEPVAQTMQIRGRRSVLGNPKAPERASDKMRDLRHPYLMVTEHLEKKVNLRVETVICEFLPGRSAATLLGNPEFKLETCEWEALRQRMLQLFGVACAVRHMHRKDVVHHDICPENMILCMDDMLHLLTFGCGATDEKDRKEYPTVVHDPYRNPLRKGIEQPDKKEDVFAFARTYFAWLMNCQAVDVTEEAVVSTTKKSGGDGKRTVTQEQGQDEEEAIRGKWLELVDSMAEQYEQGVKNNEKLQQNQKDFVLGVGFTWKEVLQFLLKKDGIAQVSCDFQEIVDGWKNEAEKLDDLRDCFGEIDVADDDERNPEWKRKPGMEKEIEMGTVAKVNEILNKYTDYRTLAEILNLEEIYYFYWFSLKDVVREEVKDETAKKEICRCFSRLLGAYRESRREDFLKEKIEIEIRELDEIADGKK